MRLLSKFAVFCVFFFLVFKASAVENPVLYPPGYFLYQDTFCSDQILLIGNGLYGPQNPTGMEILPGASANGEDSIIEVRLVFLDQPETDFFQIICEGDTIVINGNAYHANHYIGREVFTGGAANGCDSIVNVLLEVKASPFGFLTDTLCADEFLVINGTRYDYINRAGFEILENASYQGCDSLLSIDLTFRNTFLFIGGDRVVPLGDSLCIQAQFGSAPVTINWKPEAPCGVPGCLSGCIQALKNTMITLEILDEYGCTLEDTMRVIISKKNNIYFPNAINPESVNYENRYFYPYGDLGIVNVRRMVVADRWGSILFDKADFEPRKPFLGWDGRYNEKILPNDVYTYWAELVRVDGSSIIRSGTVTIIR